MTVAFVLLGVMAGALTTVAGQGGSLVLLLASAALIGPRAALAVTAPALLLGNLHRALLLRRHIDRSAALRMTAGAAPGAILGGFAAGAVPPSALRVALLVMTALAVAKALGRLRLRVSPRAFVPAGLVVGALTGTSGGAGVLLAPLLLSTGLSGPAFVATTSAIAVSMHVGRVVGYAGLGLFSGELVATTALVTAAIFAGNWLGGRVQAGLTGRGRSLVEYGALVVCAGLSVAGLA